jgi:hypothetical protein
LRARRFLLFFAFLVFVVMHGCDSGCFFERFDCAFDCAARLP